MSDPTLVEAGDAVRPGNPPMVERYRLGARINHWTTAIAMVLLVLSGLAMFHPSLFFLSDIFGGEIGIIERNRSVDQPDRNFKPAARPRHQGGKPDQA